MEDRRRAERLTPATDLEARVRAFLPAYVVDVSRSGIQLEISSLLRIGVTCDVKLNLPDGELRWPAVVRRCRATKFGVGENGEKVLLYRAGLEFSAMNDEEWGRLEQSLKARGKTAVELDRFDVLDNGQAATSGGNEKRGRPIKVKIDTSRFHS